MKAIAILFVTLAATSAVPHHAGDFFSHHQVFRPYGPYHQSPYNPNPAPAITMEQQEILRQNAVEERNKVVVRKLYQELFGDKDLSAIDRYISPTTYIQHNPDVADGRAAFKTAMSDTASEPKYIVDMQHIGADGDLVWYHLRDTTTTPGTVYSIMDIFRLENGLIVEHWDVQQEVPEKAANPHPMF